MFELEVELSFSSAHYLKNYRGKCEGLHGHNWRVRAKVVSSNLNEIGMVMDFGELKEKLKEVLEELDHKNLNELKYFQKKNPTSENIARFIFDRLNRKLLTSNLKLQKITVWETDTSSASYSQE